MFLTVVLLFLHFASAQHECEPDVIEKIKEYWKCYPQKNFIPELVGRLTYLYRPSFMLNETDGLRCLQTTQHPDLSTCTENVYYDDPSKSYTFNYNIKEKGDGGITLFSENVPDDNQYIVYCNKGVFGFYQCDTDYEPYISIAVRDCNINDFETPIAIEEAQTRLLELGKMFGPKLRTDCCNPSDDKTNRIPPRD